ncbi:winged helix family two component transcriptional regulator [Fictibacillus macauensis ZFHKF-1]|uniref:Winged helix family two component transcriptional regulator n=1 Tax=Fictibacillus macauensis ZFHKF-1 TaxID=1196324 RepID=I8AFA0_9BACL|nr:response regulator [Fictibacillus macauensis]EIT84307.1 winged helix family two component transcriptional regulator [Fictibacillus macauensis ZFHKF-1]
MKNILIVDDEHRMVELLSLYLAPHPYTVFKAYNGMEAKAVLQQEAIDLVLLDVMMPEQDGFITCQQIREKSDVPIIMLTARSQKQDIVHGLHMGADDYITKPIDEEEMLARMEAVLRRSPVVSRKEDAKTDHHTGIEGLILVQEHHEITYFDAPIVLTPKEFEMMQLLIKSPKRVFDREYLIQTIWGLDSETEGRTIDSHIRNIRDKFRKADFPIDDYLKTVWGVGYKWEQT